MKRRPPPVGAAEDAAVPKGLKANAEEVEVAAEAPKLGNRLPAVEAARAVAPVLKRFPPEATNYSINVTPFFII